MQYTSPFHQICFEATHSGADERDMVFSGAVQLPCRGG